MRASVFNTLFSRRMLVCVLTGFSSGLPLYLLHSLLPAWFETEGLDLKLIGAFALLNFPYAWKFLWAPLLDRYALPWLGRRRGWMAVFHLALLGAIAWLGTLSPRENLWLVVTLTVFLAFLSASLDVVLDAFRRNFLPDMEQELGNSIHVNAYKMSSLVPGSLALVLSAWLPWTLVFVVTALFMLPGLVMTLLVSEPRAFAHAPRTLRETVVEPFREFISRHGLKPVLYMLAFLLLYKLGDALCTSLATPFYMKMGYGPEQIGLVAKHANLWPSVVGGILGGMLMMKIGLNRALWIFGILQAVSILGFAELAQWGPVPNREVDAARLWMLAGVSGFDALATGLGTAATVSFIARSTHPAYVATQFALLTSLLAVPKTFLNPSAGWLVEQLGWVHFFWLCFVLALPGMLVLFKVAPWRGKPLASPLPAEEKKR